MVTINYSRILKAAILLPLSLYSFFGITVMSVFFGYLNQSSKAPLADRLTFANYLLPYFLTIAFIFYCTYSLITFTGKISWSGNMTKITLLVAAAIISIPWQWKHIKWESPVDNIAPYIIGMLFTIATIIVEVIRLLRTKTANNSVFIKLWRDG